MALYKVVLNGSAYGEDVKNILYYRSGFGLEVGGLTFGGTIELANAVKAQVAPSMLALLPPAYQLQDITCSVYDDGTFNPIYQNPSTVNVGLFGGGEALAGGPAVCAIIRFQLEPTIMVLNGPTPPKRGYIAMGPITDNEITDGGRINKGGVLAGLWQAVENALGGNLEQILPVPFVWFPIRVKSSNVLGIFRITSYADVRGASVRDIASFRRSRVPSI